MPEKRPSFNAGVCAALALAALGAFAAPGRAQTPGSLTASPAQALTGDAVTITATLSARAMYAAGGPQLAVEFGDGSKGTIQLNVQTSNGMRGSTVHVYKTPGAFMIKAGPLSTLVQIGATGVPLQQPVPRATGVHAAPVLALAWPDGSSTISVPPGQAVPKAVARVKLYAPAILGVEWYVDGVQTAISPEQNGEPGQPLVFTYPGKLPPGSHKVAARLALPSSLRSEPIAYDAPPSGAAPTPAPTPGGTIDVLHFDGFYVTKLSLTQSGGKYSGTGMARLADLTFAVQFKDISVSPATYNKKMDSFVGEVTAGTATFKPPSSSTPPSTKSKTAKFSAVNPINEAPCSGTFYNGPAGSRFQGQIGTFNRFGYAFSLMSIVLRPVGTSSTALLCYAPAGIEKAAAAITGGFNADDTDSTIFGGASEKNQLTLELDNTGIDEYGQFSAGLAGDKVGPYRLGSTPFIVHPTHDQTLLMFFDSVHPAPHVTFNGTPASGHIFQQVSPAQVGAKVISAQWNPGGLDAMFQIDHPAVIYPAEPQKFSITIGSSYLTISKSVFMGGTMSGSFATGVKAPSTGSAKYGGLAGFGPGAGDIAGKAADAYNAKQQAVSSSLFSAITSGLSATAGSFDGSFTANGDLVAKATGVAPFLVKKFALTPATASLFVPGGQTSYGNHSDFEALMSAIGASSFWDPNSAPAVNYQESSDAVMSGIASQIDGALAGLLGSSGAGPPASKTNQSAVLPSDVAATLGGGAVQATPDFSYPGLYVKSGTMTVPYGNAQLGFDAGTAGPGYGFAFVDGAGTSGMFALKRHTPSTYGSFPVDLQIFNILIDDGNLVATNFWGALRIPAPIDATLPVNIQQVADDGTLGGLAIPSGVHIPLTAWSSSLLLQQAAPVGTDAVKIKGVPLQLPGVPGTPAVNGSLRSDGKVENEALDPVSSIAQTRIAGLDFSPIFFRFSPGHPARVVGEGSIAGWSNQKFIALDITSSGFVPPPGFNFSVAQSIGVVDFDANLKYASGSWDGKGSVNSTDFISATFGFHVDDAIEKGTFGVSVPGGSGSSSAGPLSLADIAGEATFNRDDGSLQAMAFGAAMNLSKFQGKAVVLYRSPLNDPVVMKFGGASQLGARGWDCSQAWCFAASAKAQFDSSDALSGEVDGLFQDGFAIYMDGELTTPIAHAQAQGQFAYFKNGDWDFGLAYYPIPILTIQFGGKFCVWNHTGGHGGNCLDSGHAESGYGFYGGVHADKDLGSLASASVDQAFFGSNGGGFGSHLHGHGSAGIAGVGADVDANMDYGTSPIGMKGSAKISFCACLGSLDATIGASWYDGSGISLDSASLGLSGPCGVCSVLDPSSWF